MYIHLDVCMVPHTFFLIGRHGGSTARIPNNSDVDKGGGVLEGVECLVPGHTLHRRVVDFENFIARFKSTIFIGRAAGNDLLDVDTVEEGVCAACYYESKHLVTFEDYNLTFFKRNDIWRREGIGCR